MTPIIPKHARTHRWLVNYDHDYQSATFELDGKIVGERTWDLRGDLDSEWGIKDGRRHGPQRRRTDGVLTFETNWVDGKEHGIARQYWDDGRPLGTYKMVHGTGVDLWRCNLTGKLSEEWHWTDGEMDGLVRFWNDDEKTIWEEKHCKASVEHGIFREWNDKGRLRRGFPQYYINGKKVRKREYLTGCKRDETLPAFREEDNNWHRPLPAEYLRPEE